MQTWKLVLMKIDSFNRTFTNSNTNTTPFFRHSYYGVSKNIDEDGRVTYPFHILIRMFAGEDLRCQTHIVQYRQGNPLELNEVGIYKLPVQFLLVCCYSTL